MRKLFLIVVCAITISTAAKAQEYVTKPIFQGYTSVGTVFFGGGPSVKWGFDFNASLGARVDDYVYVGVESGLAVLDAYRLKNYFVAGNVTSAYVPIACNFRFLFPTSASFIPYINLSLGGYLGVIDMDSNGFYLQIGAGFDVKRFTFGIGYTGLGDHGFSNAGYLKIGVKFGGKTW